MNLIRVDIGRARAIAVAATLDQLREHRGGVIGGQLLQPAARPSRACATRPVGRGKSFIHSPNLEIDNDRHAGRQEQEIPTTKGIQPSKFREYALQ